MPTSAAPSPPWARQRSAPRRGRPGRIHSSNGPSARSDASVSTTSSCSTSGISEDCSAPTSPPISGRGHTWRLTRTLPSRGRWRQPGRSDRGNPRGRRPASSLRTPRGLKDHAGTVYQSVLSGGPEVCRSSTTSRSVPPAASKMPHTKTRTALRRASVTPADGIRAHDGNHGVLARDTPRVSRTQLAMINAAV
jgi:hypothetical protein